MNSHFIEPFRSRLFNLIQAPNSVYFDKNDTVYDLTKLFTWIHKEKPTPIFFNKTKSEILARLSNEESYKLIGLLESLGPGIPRTFHTTATFYEVDSRKPMDEPWSLHTVLTSNSKPLLRSAFCNLSGEVSHTGSRHSHLKLGLTAGDDGIHAEHFWKIDINNEKLKIKKKLDLLVPNDGTTIVELQNRGNGRSIIIVIKTKEELYYKVENRFQK